jgi:hypothetical protein
VPAGKDIFNELFLVGLKMVRMCVCVREREDLRLSCVETVYNEQESVRDDELVTTNDDE